MADLCYWEAVRAGAEVIDTDFSAFCLGTAHPPLESMLIAFSGTPYAAEMDMGLIAEINGQLKEIKAKYSQYQSKFTGVDTSVLQHQIPGGMLSNMESQLREMHAYDRLPEVLAEVSRVHEEFGYPPLGTPFSQIVGTQATMNVIQGERYKIVPKESRAYMRGEYGQFPAPWTRRYSGRSSAARSPSPAARRTSSPPSGKRPKRRSAPWRRTKRKC